MNAGFQCMVAGINWLSASAVVVFFFGKIAHVSQIKSFYYCVYEIKSSDGSRADYFVPFQALRRFTTL